MENAIDDRSTPGAVVWFQGDFKPPLAFAMAKVFRLDKALLLTKKGDCTGQLLPFELSISRLEVCLYVPNLASMVSFYRKVV